MNDQNRFDFEVTLEEFEMDQVNGDLQILADEAANEAARLAYAEYIDSMLLSLYEDQFSDSEWDF